MDLSQSEDITKMEDTKKNVGTEAREVTEVSNEDFLKIYYGD